MMDTPPRKLVVSVVVVMWVTETMTMASVEVVAARHGNHSDGIKVLEEIHVLYKDAEGRLHEVHVTWNQVKDLHI
jgi:hypothetical protein